MRKQDLSFAEIGSDRVNISNSEDQLLRVLFSLLLLPILE